ncbi:guanine nucleotide-binding protein subunit beta [Trichomonascus vanleenenianus]|uniref:G protein subunit beta n=1 Tax=Trichomonascus vanleenenianus TaxID=2268995 RepID=UPI003EC99FCE
MSSQALAYNGLDIWSLTTQEKLRYITSIKAETESLRGSILEAKRQYEDTTLPQIASRTPPLTGLDIRGKNIFKGHVGKIYDMKLTGDDRYIVSVAQDGFAIVWDAYSTSKCDAILLDSPWVLSCAISPSNKIIATGGLDNVCTLYPFYDDVALSPTVSSKKRRSDTIKPRPPLMHFKGHRGFISGAEFISEALIVTVSSDMTMKMWDVVRGLRLRDYGDHIGDINAVSVSHTDPNIISTAAADNSVKIWDTRVPADRAVQTFITDTELTAIDIFPDGKAIGAGCENGTVKLFDMRCDAKIAEYESSRLSHQAVTAVKFTPSGRLLLTGLSEGSCGTWDILKGQWIPQRPDHSSEVTSIQVASDGHRMYSSSWDSTIRSWEP